MGEVIVRGSRARELTIAAIFAALMAIGALFSVPFYPVPLSLQTFFVYLSVLVLRRKAFLSQAIYLLMGIAGLPVFSKGMAGYAVLLGPTGGFLIGFLLAAAIGGFVYGKAGPGLRSSAVAVAVSLIVTFGTGWAWLTYWLGGNAALAFFTGVLPFLPGDFLKAPFAIVVSGRLLKQGIGIGKK